MSDDRQQKSLRASTFGVFFALLLSAFLLLVEGTVADTLGVGQGENSSELVGLKLEVEQIRLAKGQIAAFQVEHKGDDSKIRTALQQLVIVGKAEIECSTLLRVHSEGEINSQIDFIYPTEYGPPGPLLDLSPWRSRYLPFAQRGMDYAFLNQRPQAADLLTAFEERPLGDRLKVSATLGQDPSQVRVEMEYENVLLKKITTVMPQKDKWGSQASYMPVFSERSSKTAVTVKLNRYYLLQLLTGKLTDEGGTEIATFFRIIRPSKTAQ